MRSLHRALVVSILGVSAWAAWPSDGVLNRDFRVVLWGGLAATGSILAIDLASHVFAYLDARALHSPKERMPRLVYWAGQVTLLLAVLGALPTYFVLKAVVLGKDPPGHPVLSIATLLTLAAVAFNTFLVRSWGASRALFDWGPSDPSTDESANSAPPEMQESDPLPAWLRAWLDEHADDPEPEIKSVWPPLGWQFVVALAGAASIYWGSATLRLLGAILLWGLATIVLTTWIQSKEGSHDKDGG